MGPFIGLRCWDVTSLACTKKIDYKVLRESEGEGATLLNTREVNVEQILIISNFSQIEFLTMYKTSSPTLVFRPAMVECSPLGGKTPTGREEVVLI